MKKKGKPENNDNESKTPTRWSFWGGCILIAFVVLWVLIHIYKGDWYGGLSEPSIIALLVLGVALLLLPNLKKFSLPGGLGFEFRDSPKEVENIRDTEQVGEVVFNKEQSPPHDFFWIDKNHKKRKLPNEDTASLFMTRKGAVGVSKSVFNNFSPGPDIAAIVKDNFRYVQGGHLYVILDNRMIAYLPSWRLHNKYGIKSLNDMKEIKPEDFENYDEILQ